MGFFIMEVWKEIKGYENLYEVSSYGNIRSLNAYGKGIIKYMTPLLGQRGYFYIGLWKDKVRTAYKIHRLVAVNFIENELNCPCINHKNGNKLDNNVSNLEWNTYKQNTRHAYDTGLIKRGPMKQSTRDLIAKNSSKKVINVITGEIFSSCKEAALKNGHVYTTLKSRLNGSNKKNETNLKYI